MTTGRLQTKRRRTDHSNHSIQFAIGVVIAVAAVLGIEYALQQITQTPPPVPEPVSSIDPAEPTSPSDEWVAAHHSDPPGFATVRDAQPVEQSSVPLSDAHPTADVHYFPIRGEATADSPDPNGSSNPVPARLAAPVPGRATPIRPGTDSHKKQLRSIIRQELPLASADEHEIWLNALRGLAPRMVRQLLRLRRVIREEGPPVIAETSRQPVSTRPIGSTRNKTAFPDTSASRPVTGPLPTSRTRTVGRTELPAHLVPECLNSAVDAVNLARDVLLDNIANANTVGFKRRRVFFESLSYTRVRSHETVGLGVQVSQIRCDHSPGPLRTTRGPLDLAIDGDGFFQIQAGPEILYTRAGNFQLNANGEIVLKTDGRHLLLEPTLTVPQDAISLVISRNGTVSVRQPLVPDLTQIGTIQLARFVNPAGLELRGGNLFAVTGESGQSYLGDPGAGGLGKVRQFCLEQSNVRPKDELRSLIRLQQQLLTIWQAVKILSESGEFNNPPTERRPSPGPLVREPVPLTGSDGPKLSRQPAPTNQ